MNKDSLNCVTGESAKIKAERERGNGRAVSRNEIEVEIWN